MIIWILVIVSAFTSALSLASLDANAEIRAMSAQVYRRHGLNRSAPMGCLIALGGVANLGLWIAYAIEADDWRFAAIFVMPWVVASIALPLHTRITKSRPSVQS